MKNVLYFGPYKNRWKTNFDTLWPYENNRIHKSSKDFFDDNFLGLESVEYGEAFVGYFAFKGNGFEDRAVYSFFHLSTSTYVNSALFFEEMFSEKFLILFD